MIVVSNTTPVVSLTKCGMLWLLPALFTTVHIAEAVVNEAKTDGINISEEQGFMVHSISESPVLLLLLRDIERGEAETIALAHTIEADITILDERLGYGIAKQ